MCIVWAGSALIRLLRAGIFRQTWPSQNHLEISIFHVPSVQIDNNTEKNHIK